MLAEHFVLVLQVRRAVCVLYEKLWMCLIYQAAIQGLLLSANSFVGLEFLDAFSYQHLLLSARYDANCGFEVKVKLVVPVIYERTAAKADPRNSVSRHNYQR